MDINKEKIKEKIDKHNESVLKSGVKIEHFLVLKTGAKGKKFTLYGYKSYLLKNGLCKPSMLSGNRWFIEYLKTIDDILPYLKNKSYKNCLFQIRQYELNTNKTANVEKWKFLQFGKYAKTNIDDLPKIDYSYCIWLIKNSTERKFKSDFFNQLDEYIISQSFQDKVLKAKLGYKDVWQFRVNNKDVLCDISDINFGFPINYEIIKKQILFFQQKKDFRLDLFKIKDKAIFDKIIKNDKVICEIYRYSTGIKVNVTY